MRRLSAEEIRDSILAINGRLNPAMYGPSIYPEISKEVLAGQSFQVAVGILHARKTRHVVVSTFMLSDRLSYRCYPVLISQRRMQAAKHASSRLSLDKPWVCSMATSWMKSRVPLQTDFAIKRVLI